jgi:hypothetical protein
VELYLHSPCVFIAWYLITDEILFAAWFILKLHYNFTFYVKVCSCEAIQLCLIFAAADDPEAGSLFVRGG